VTEDTNEGGSKENVWIVENIKENNKEIDVLRKNRRVNTSLDDNKCS
jgi:hypothetical protein